jgi:hypothetical protein
MRRGKRQLRTYLVDHGEAVGEAAGRAAGKVDAVGQVVGLGQRREVVVVAVVRQRVPEHEHRRHARPRSRRLPRPRAAAPSEERAYRERAVPRREHLRRRMADGGREQQQEEHRGCCHWKCRAVTGRLPTSIGAEQWSVCA